jgi:hypothetical protein
MSVRAYDPTLGRFISHDPLGRLAAASLDIQPYVYAGNDPVNSTDPSGMLILGPNGQKAIITPSGPKIVDPGCESCQTTTSGGSGGGGKGPATATQPAKPTHAQMVQDARGIAQSAASHYMDQIKAFLGVSIKAMALELILQGAAGLAAALPFGIGDALAAVLEAVAVVVDAVAILAASLAIEAGALAAEFSWESQQSDDYWTASNIQNFKGVVDMTDIAFTLGLVALGGLEKALFKATKVVSFIKGAVYGIGGTYQSSSEMGPYADNAICNEKQAIGASCF